MVRIRRIMRIAQMMLIANVAESFSSSTAGKPAFRFEN
jgi:hypothetical protein